LSNPFFVKENQYPTNINWERVKEFNIPTPDDIDRFPTPYEPNKLNPNDTREAVFAWLLLSGCSAKTDNYDLLSVSCDKNWDGLAIWLLTHREQEFDLLNNNNYKKYKKYEQGVKTVSIPWPNIWAQYGRTDMLKAWLDTGVDPDQKDNSGETALFHAKTTAEVLTLLKAGANPLVLDRQKRTLVDYWKKFKFEVGSYSYKHYIEQEKKLLVLSQYESIKNKPIEANNNLHFLLNTLSFEEDNLTDNKKNKSDRIEIARNSLFGKDSGFPGWGNIAPTYQPPSKWNKTNGGEPVVGLGWVIAKQALLHQLGTSHNQFAKMDVSKLQVIVSEALSKLPESVLKYKSVDNIEDKVVLELVATYINAPGYENKRIGNDDAKTLISLITTTHSSLQKGIADQFFKPINKQSFRFSLKAFSEMLSVIKNSDLKEHIALTKLTSLKSEEEEHFKDEFNRLSDKEKSSWINTLLLLLPNNTPHPWGGKTETNTFNRLVYTAQKMIHWFEDWRPNIRHSKLIKNKDMPKNLCVLIESRYINKVMEKDSSAPLPNTNKKIRI